MLVPSIVTHYTTNDNVCTRLDTNYAWNYSVAQMGGYDLGGYVRTPLAVMTLKNFYTYC